MLPVQLADIEMAVRAVLHVPPSARAGTAAALVAQTRRNRRTLMTVACGKALAPRPADYSGASLEALSLVINALGLPTVASKTVT